MDKQEAIAFEEKSSKFYGYYFKGIGWKPIELLSSDTGIMYKIRDKDKVEYYQPKA